MSDRVSIEKFGKDHWSLLIYIETCNVDKRAKVDEKHMRILVHGDGEDWKYGTRLNDGTVLDTHDDWDCIYDFVEEGIIYPSEDAFELGTVLLTDYGWYLAGQLRRRRAHRQPDAKFKVGSSDYNKGDCVLFNIDGCLVNGVITGRMNERALIIDFDSKAYVRYVVEVHPSDKIIEPEGEEGLT